MPKLFKKHTPPKKATAAQSDAGSLSCRLNAVRCLGVTFIEYDPRTAESNYEPTISNLLAGTYDERPLLEIWQAEKVAHEEDIPRILAYINQQCAAPESHDSFHIELKTPSGEFRWFALHVSPCTADPTQGHVIILLSDAHAQMLERQRVREADERDSLTGLYNRNTFLQLTSERVRSAPPGTYVLVYFDVDRFGLINDRCGHNEGDRFLQQVAEGIYHDFPTEAIAARLNADVFALCIPRCANRLSLVNRGFRFSSDAITETMHMTGRFGFYIIDDPTLPGSVMLERAFRAHSSVKGRSSQRYAYYEPQMDSRHAQEREMELTMRDALDNGHFNIYLQPQYNLQTGNLVGAEALVRWIHPKRGVIAPDLFIPLFERNGFITDLDYYVWNRVCGLLKKWSAVPGGPVLPISVNISRVDLFSIHLVDRLTNLVKQYELSPSLLKLEITETAYAEDSDQLIELVTRLREAGFSVSMDDFGSGYSSLNMLKDVPVDSVKLDMRFLAGQGTTGRGGAIVGSIIRMTKWLCLPVIAEGVETTSQARYLKTLGCEYAQGYLYSKPMPVPEFETLLYSSTTGDASQTSTISYIPDINAFWNPDSQETLIFNSYVGGAVIVEYVPGRLELLRYNDEYLNMLNITTKEELEVLRFPFVLLSDQDRQVYVDMLEQAIATNGEARCITRRLLPGRDKSQTVWFRTRARVLAKSHVRTLFYIALEDVTAEHVAQMNFKESQDILLTAITHAQLFYWVYDMENNRAVQGALSQSNAGLPQVYENYPQSIVDLDYFHPDSVSTYLAMYDRIKAGEKQVYCDVKSRRDDGTYEWRRNRYTVITDEDGVCRRAIGTSESMEAYKQLEERYLTAAVQNNMRIWTYNITTGQYQFDHAFEPGVLDSHETAKTLLAGIHPDDLPILAKQHNALKNGAHFAECTVRYLDNDDIIWYHIIYTVNADPNDAADVAIGTAVNISPLVALKNRYKAAIAYYEGLNPDDYISIIQVDFIKNSATFRSGQTQDYDAFLLDLTKRIPDMDQREMVFSALQLPALRAKHAGGANRFEYEYRLEMDSGKLHWVETFARVLLNVDTNGLIAIICTRDINEQKMTKEAFSKIIYNDYTFVAGLDLIEGGYQVYSSDPSNFFQPELHGATFQETVQAFAGYAVHPDDRETFLNLTAAETIRARLDTADTYTFHYRRKNKSGEYCPCRLTVCYIDKQVQNVCIASQRVEEPIKRLADGPGIQQKSPAFTD